MMKYYFGVENKEELTKYQSFIQNNETSIIQFLQYLQENFQVKELPEVIVFTNKELATQYISQIPIPSYTNDYRIIFMPDIEEWKKIYLNQINLIQINDSNIQKIQKITDYYQRLNEHHLLQILGHEFVHHSDLFLDEYEQDSETPIWFEEGMCEYISRRYFLTEEEYEEEMEINKLIIELLSYQNQTLNDFKTSLYSSDYSHIFYEYWKSFLTIHNLIQQKNDVGTVFHSYHEWFYNEPEKSLEKWFQLEKDLK